MTVFLPTNIFAFHFDYSKSDAYIIAGIRFVCIVTDLRMEPVTARLNRYVTIVAGMVISLAIVAEELVISDCNRLVLNMILLHISQLPDAVIFLSTQSMRSLEVFKRLTHPDRTLQLKMKIIVDVISSLAIVFAVVLLNSLRLLSVVPVFIVDSRDTFDRIVRTESLYVTYVVEEVILVATVVIWSEILWP